MEKKYNKNGTENPSEILNLEKGMKFFHKIKKLQKRKLEILMKL